jgi:hypothetical protein
MTDRGGREAEFVRCFLEAEVAGGGLEGAQCAEWWKPSHGWTLDEKDSSCS